MKNINQQIQYQAHLLLRSQYKIIILLIFYFACINLHYFDVKQNIVDCMPGGYDPSARIMATAGSNAAAQIELRINEKVRLVEEAQELLRQQLLQQASQYTTLQTEINQLTARLDAAENGCLSNFRRGYQSVEGNGNQSENNFFRYLNNCSSIDIFNMGTAACVIICTAVISAGVVVFYYTGVLANA